MKRLLLLIMIGSGIFMVHGPCAHGLPAEENSNPSFEEHFSKLLYGKSGAGDEIAPPNDPNSSGNRNPFQSQLPQKAEEPPIQQAEISRPGIPDQNFPPDFQQPGREIPTPPPALTISGLIWNTDRPQAIVNDQIVEVGDVIQEAKVLAIYKTGIDVLYYEKTFTISSTQTANDQL